jgi:hypothetical protein
MRARAALIGSLAIAWLLSFALQSMPVKIAQAAASWL